METAYRMQAEAPEVFSLKGESQATLERYGKSDFARGCLMARRLIERGVRIVQLYAGGPLGQAMDWDSHTDILAHRQLACESDSAMAGLIIDSKERGLLKDTLVLIGSEFGRTPVVETGEISLQSGRDHNALGFTYLLAGGGVRAGFTYGATDPINYHALTNRYNYNHSSKHRFFGRWTSSDYLEGESDWTYETVRRLQSSDLSRSNLGGTVDWVYSHSASTLLNVTISGNQFREANIAEVARTLKPSDVGLPAYEDAKAGEQPILPRMMWAGHPTVSRPYPVYTRYRMLTGKADISHVRGSHSLRAGIDIRQHFRTSTTGGNTSGTFTFNNLYTQRTDDGFTPAGDLGHSWAAFMLGLPTAATIDTVDTFALHNPYYGWHAQDQWRLSSKLTLNLGIRIEFENGPTERYNRQLTYFDPNAALPITEGAQAAYAAQPTAGLPASSFIVRGGSVYAGVAGADRRRWQDELLWMPRLSAAYQIDNNTVLRTGYGIFYDMLNVLNVGPDQFCFSRVTSTNFSNDFGATWLAGNPAAGISPMADPFPVRSDGTRFDVPVRTGLGSMATVGTGWNYHAFDTKRARMQRWRVGLQRQLGSDMVVEAAYAGSYANRVHFIERKDALPEGYWAKGLTRNNAIATDLNSNVPNPFHISNFAGLRTTNPVVYQQMSTLGFFTSPTIRKNQLLRPFPQMNANGLLQANLPEGEARSHALEISFLRRFAQGFNLNIAYTALIADERTILLDEFARPSEWIPTQNGRPHRFTGMGIFEFPFGKGRRFWQRGPLNHIFGGWQIGLTYEYQPGPLLDFGNVFYYGDIAHINTGPRSLEGWFNTEGFERTAARGPAMFHRRVFPQRIDGLRADNTSNWNSNLLRQLRFDERWSLQLRLDALNLQNRSQFNVPNVNPFSTDFAKVRAQAGINRVIQIQARIQF